MNPSRIQRELRLTVIEGNNGLTLGHLRELLIQATDAAMPETVQVLSLDDHGGWKKAAQLRLDGGDLL